MKNIMPVPNPLVVSMLIVVCLSAAASAQTPVDSGDLALLRNRVKAGDTVVVNDSASRQTVGTLTEVSESMIVLKLRGIERSIPLADVREVAIKGDSVRNGALIGAIIGATLTLAAGASWCADYACSRPVLDTMAVAAMNAVVFGGIGALIDKAHSGRTVVYRGRRTQTSLQPMLGLHRLGLKVAISL